MRWSKNNCFFTNNNYEIFLHMKKHKKIIINFSSKKHKQIFIVTNWQIITKTKLFHRSYFLSKNSKISIDKKFDTLHKKRKLKWFNDFTSFEFSMFTIWKIMFVKFDKISTRKEKVVIDIRDLNKIFMFVFFFKTILSLCYKKQLTSS